MAGPSDGPLSDPKAFEALAERLGMTPRVTLIVAPYYQDVANALVAGAMSELEVARAEVDRVDVPGALEMPQAFEIIMNGDDGYLIDAVVAIGCVIRGETSHYDIVCNESNRGLMNAAVRWRVPLGNALLTVDTHEQAMVRATAGRSGKGGDAARAALSLLQLKADRGLAGIEEGAARRDVFAGRGGQ